MRIKGFVGTSLVDYPGKVASVVFVGGCNFSCPYCFNIDLVVYPDDMEDIPEEEVLEKVTQRRDFIDGVVVSGGEPTLEPQLTEFLKRVRELGLLVKLDSNGSRPQVLEKILRENLVDFIAMDYKGPISGYEDLAGASLDTETISLSTRLIMGSRVDYEFRTTIHPGLLQPEDILQIARELKGAKKYVLQPFHAKACLDPSIGFPPQGYMKNFQAALESVKGNFGEVLIRGEE